MKYFNLFILFIVIFWGCTKEDNKRTNQNCDVVTMKPTLSLEGALFREKYVDPFNPLKSQIAYIINITITNIGNYSFTYRELEVSFLPENGNPLKLLLLPGEKSKSYSNNNEKVTVELKPGESTTIPGISTNGHTDDLTSNSKSKSVIFSISILDNGKVISGPYTTTLPNIEKLKNLPSYHQTLQNKNFTGYKLNF